MSNEIVAATNVQAVTTANITQQSAGAMVTSFKADPNDRATSAKIFNAMNNPSEKISAHINETIEVQDYLVEIAEIEETDQYGMATGSTATVPRVVLVSPDGTAYQAVSVGMANAVRNIVAVCGDAPWNPAVQLKIKQVPTKNGSMLTVEMVG